MRGGGGGELYYQCYFVLLFTQTSSNSRHYNALVFYITFSNKQPLTKTFYVILRGLCSQFLCRLDVQDRIRGSYRLLHDLLWDLVQNEDKTYNKHTPLKQQHYQSFSTSNKNLFKAQRMIKSLPKLLITWYGRNRLKSITDQNNVLLDTHPNS